MTSQSLIVVQTEVEKIVQQLEFLLKRTDADPRPVVIMMCGVAGKYRGVCERKQLLSSTTRLREINLRKDCSSTVPEFQASINRRHTRGATWPLRH